jgi:small subunit ribosomal protein S9
MAPDSAKKIKTTASSKKSAASGSDSAKAKTQKLSVSNVARKRRTVKSASPLKSEKKIVSETSFVSDTLKPEQEAEEKIIFDTKRKYIEAVGRRKNAVARVRLFTHNKKGVEINGKPLQEYFQDIILQKTVLAPLEKLKCQDKFSVVVKVKGGGFCGQAEAIRHAIARTLLSLNPYFKKRLKKSGYLTRDPRMRERKKFGLKRARRAPQWSKR